MQTETIIFSNHNLDTSKIDILANQLAKLLKLNIEICENQNGEKVQNIISGNSNNEDRYNLNLNNLGNSKYVLEIGEIGILISDEIISYELPLVIPFNSINPNKMDSTHTFVVNKLKALGATEIVFAEDSETARSLNQSNISFDKFKAAVTQNSNYKIIH